MNNSQEKTAQLQNIINAIPGGVAIYKVSDIFETVYYSDGVPPFPAILRQNMPNLSNRTLSI